MKYEGGTNPVVFLPFYGEFGWLILKHIRHVHHHPSSEKVVCCERGQECLFPTASAFFYDWTGIPDDVRCGDSSLSMHHRCVQLDTQLRTVLHDQFPAHLIIRPQYDCPWHTSDLIKFQPYVSPVLPPVDVVLGVRHRKFWPTKNWPYWDKLVKKLQGEGLKVGLVGSREASLDLAGAVTRSWEHPNGATAGTVDLLSRCSVYVGTDSGVSHLAALMDVPMLVFRKEEPGNPDLTGIMERANRRLCLRVGKAGWEDVELVYTSVLSRLKVDKKPLQLHHTYSQYGEDRWLWENRDLPAYGTFVEVGAGHPRDLSNTLAFEEAGWTGILVEPDPRRHADLRSHRNARLYTCAVGQELGWGWLGMLPNPDLSGLGRSSRQRIEVEIRPLETLLQQSRIESIDLLSIDTEGTELEVWSSFNVVQHRPHFVIVEWNTVGQSSRKELILKQMHSDDYALIHTTEANLIFERR